jgi:hypothetical protein
MKSLFKINIFYLKLIKNKWFITLLKLPMAFSTYGVKKPRPLGCPGSVRGIKEWTEGWLVVRLSQVSKVSR